MASTSQLVEADVHLRQRPELLLNTNLHDPPAVPALVYIHHPANQLCFLTLPAYDCDNSSPPKFGLHYGTLITACRILACSKAGYISTFEGDNQAINSNWDSIIVSGHYYYHLNPTLSELLYPVCRNFAAWKFPHHEMPLSWEKELPQSVPEPENDWTALSIRIKLRDVACLVSGWKDSLTTAHIVPKVHEAWLVKNDMHPYLTGALTLNYDSRNLFTLRNDLHNSQFDRATFVIVPKSGQLVLNFLQHSVESAQMYHNVPFTHNDVVAHELLYARFAWALMELLKNRQLDRNLFNFWGEEDEGGPGPGQPRGQARGRPRGSGRGRGRGGGGGNDKGKKRQREDDDNHPRRSIRLKKQNDAQELEEDMKIAAKVVPFFVDPNGKANARDYEHIVWYPGKAAVERRKQAYLEGHPQIRSHSGQLLPENCDLSDDSLE